MQIEDNLEFLRPVKSDELLPAVDRWAILGGFFLLGSCGMVIVLAAIIKYPITVKAPAIVRPVGELRIVEAATQGVVKNIAVKENQVVSIGEVIATLDSSQLETRKSQINLNIRQNQLQLTQIDAQQAALATQITAEENVSQRTVASAQADLKRIQQEYKDKLSIAHAEVDEASAGLSMAKEEMARYQQLGNTGAISQLQIKEKFHAFKAALARQQRAKVGLNPSVANETMAQEHIATEQARGKSTLAVLNKEQKNLQQQRVQIENQINTDKEELKQILTDLQKSTIRTAIAGVILKMELRNPSQVVQPGQAIATIAPQNAPMVIKAHIGAKDISKVQICGAQKVKDCQQGKVIFRVSAYPYPDYGTLRGAVRAISADTITPQNSDKAAIEDNANNSRYYEVTIEPENVYLQKDNKTYPIKPGMEVLADIISREETVLTFILRKARFLTGV